MSGQSGSVTVQVEERERPLAEVVAAKLVTARAMVITDQASYNAVVEMRGTMKALRDAIVTAHEKPKKDKYDVWKAEVAAEAADLVPVTEVEKLLKEKTFKWDADQERKRQAEQARLEAEARKKAEEEALAAAIAAEKAGAPAAEVEAVLAQPIIAAPVVAPRTYTPAPRMAGRESWSAKPAHNHNAVAKSRQTWDNVPDEDIKALICFVADRIRAKDDSYVCALMMSASVLNDKASSQKSMMKIPGVEAKCDRV